MSLNFADIPENAETVGQGRSCGPGPVFHQTPPEAVREVVREQIWVRNRHFEILRPTHPHSLLDDPTIIRAFAEDEYLPYWAELWPSSLLLGEAILAETWPDGLRALELGCGLGLGGLVALSCGLRVTFSDYDVTALEFAARNARLNGFSEFEVLRLDWRHPPALRFPLILGADVLYEARNVLPILDCIQNMLSDNGLCLIVDPERTPAPAFRAELERRGMPWSADLLRKNDGTRSFQAMIYRIRQPNRAAENVALPRPHDDDAKKKPIITDKLGDICPSCEKVMTAPQVPTQISPEVPDPQTLRRISEELDQASPQEILRWAVATYHPYLSMATAFGAEGCCIIHMLAEIEPKVHIFNLDTGYQFKETLQMRDRIRERYGIEVELVRPDTTVEEYERLHNGPLYVINANQCCHDRKIVPLRRALQGKKAWISAIRADQTADRAKADIVMWDNKFRLVKVNPLLRWTRRDVWEFILKHDIPYNPLHDQGYPSIGCEPCTEPVEDGRDERAGRWAGTGKKECGLHVQYEDQGSGI